MPPTEVLVEAQNPFADAVSDLLTAAHFKPVRKLGAARGDFKILHQIKKTAYSHSGPGGIDGLIQRVYAEVKRTRQRHHNRRVVFCVPGMSSRDFVRVFAGITNAPETEGPVDLSNTPSDAVTRLIERAQGADTPRPAFALDRLAEMATQGADLRDESGKLDAEKVRELFGLKLTVLAEAAGISKQGLDQNPASEKAQPLLKNFERIARLRTHPQFRDPVDLRKWFRRPLALFQNHSAEDLFKAGKLELVAEKVDQLLTGDFGG